jgi:hypothetical protein
MQLDAITRAVLEHYTAHPPRTEDAWYGPWNAILASLFPSTQGYLVSPQQRLPSDDQSHIPDFVIEVVKLSTPPLTLRTVLIVKIMNTQHWPSGIQALRRQLGRQTNAAFAGTARDKVYWIGAIGPRWQYGEKIDDGGAAQELTEWHDTTHDLVSFNDLQALVQLVAAL